MRCPKPAPAEQLNLAAGKHEANQEMAEGDVTEPQLAQSNEPQFQQALADKKAAAAHADTAPGEFRKQETEVIQQGQADATDDTAGVTGMQSAKGAALAKLVADKGKTKTKDEAKRAEVTAKIQSIFTATEADVKKILDGIDPKVEDEFDEGEAAARATFETYVAAKMSAYKKDRYSGWLGGLRWAKDKLFGMPDKVNEFYEAGRELYLKQMDKVISRVADIVGNDLNAAKKRIADGRNRDRDLRQEPPERPEEGRRRRVAGDRRTVRAAGERGRLQAGVGGRHPGLEVRRGPQGSRRPDRGAAGREQGPGRQGHRRHQGRHQHDPRAGRDAHERAGPGGRRRRRHHQAPGCVPRQPDRRHQGRHPQVQGQHPRSPAQGTAGLAVRRARRGGVELPDTFDIKGIIKLLASIFGLTWTIIRNRIVKQIGEKAMGGGREGRGDLPDHLAREGVGGLWEMLLEKLGDIKEMILGQVKDFVVTKIITAGITWLIGLLNPAAAFIKACKLIYDIVMFFVNNASRIAKFVNTIIDSVADIVRGNVGGVVNKIDDVLGQMVPIIIGFLASVIGLGGIGQKIREIVDTLQKPINKALDFVIKTGLKLAGPIIRGIKGISGKVKAKVAAGKAWVKGKILGGDDTPTGKQKRLDRGLSAAQAAVNRLPGKRIAAALARPVLAAIRMRFGMTSLDLVARGERWMVRGVVNPGDEEETRGDWNLHSTRRSWHG